MRKREIFSIFCFVIVVIFLNFVSACPDEQRIMKLSSASNAHGSLYDSNYQIEICYNDIFGSSFVPVTGENFRACKGNNSLVDLSSTTNSHAEFPNKSNYAYNICYGNLDCRITQGDCDASSGEKFIVSLSSDTNSHLAVNPQYANKACCKLAVAPQPVIFDKAFWVNKTTLEGINQVNIDSEVGLYTLADSLKSGATKNVNFIIKRIDVSGDETIIGIPGTINSTGGGLATWQAGKRSDGSFRAGNYYFIVDDGIKQVNSVMLGSVFGILIVINISEPPITCDNDLVKDSGEQCDGSDFGGKTCVDYGFTSGSLSCSNCIIDNSNCGGTPLSGCGIYTDKINCESNEAGEIAKSYLGGSSFCDNINICNCRCAWNDNPASGEYNCYARFDSCTVPITTSCKVNSPVEKPGIEDEYVFEIVKYGIDNNGYPISCTAESGCSGSYVCNTTIIGGRCISSDDSCKSTLVTYPKLSSTAVPFFSWISIIISIMIIVMFYIKLKKR